MFWFDEFGVYWFDWDFVDVVVVDFEEWECVGVFGEVWYYVVGGCFE